MSWSIKDVAAMAKVSSRTLRHYHGIGLLTPAGVGGNGYRYYEREQLLRLQQILLLRELGLRLDTIAEVLDGQRDEAEALRGHHAWLLAESARLGRLAETVANTVAELEGGNEMPAEDLFEGFAEKQARFEEELVDRYGEGVRQHFAESRKRTKGWTREDYQRAGEQWNDLDARVLELLRSGAAPDDPRTLDVIAEHYASVCQFWTPNRASYTGLGELYVEHPEYRARYDALDPALAEYLRDAVAAYARARLA